MIAQFVCKWTGNWPIAQRASNVSDLFKFPFFDVLTADNAISIQIAINFIGNESRRIYFYLNYSLIQFLSQFSVLSHQQNKS